ncbi:14967_t:CDS:2 [Gigaspora rosea]|nr:14967_t:CDS:2 [Gigaspora rosea]
MKQPSHYHAFSRKATDLHQGLKNLNKILKQATDPQLPTSPQHLITDEVITEPREIKYEIAQYYEHWTRENTPNELLREEWAHAFAPKDEIQEQWYNDINQAITVEKQWKADLQTLDLSPSTPGKMIKCKGCPETSWGKSTCYITAPISILTNIQVDRQKHIHTDINDLQNALQNPNPSHTPPTIFTGHLSHKDMMSKEMIDSITNINTQLWAIYQQIFSHKATFIATIHTYNNHTVPSVAWTLKDLNQTLHTADLTWPTRKKSILTNIITLMAAHKLQQIRKNPILLGLRKISALWGKEHTTTLQDGPKNNPYPKKTFYPNPHR